MVDQVEEGGFGPLEVIEHDEERLRAREPFKDPARLQRDLVAVRLEVDLRRK